MKTLIKNIKEIVGVSINENTSIKSGKKLKEISSDKKTSAKLNDSLRLFIRIINAYTSKEYTYVPWKTICLIVAGLIYFIYPVDLIPDFIPVSGLIDDVALIAWIYESIQDDIEKFLEWEKSLK